MTASIYDHIWQTSTTTGTGAFAVSGAAPTGFRLFGSAMLVNPENVYYTIEHQTADEWEVGYGSLDTSGTDTLTRTQVLSSSNAGSLVNFSAGTKNVRLDIQSDVFNQVRGKNIIANGNFNVWQRGTSFAAALNAYTADRWKLSASGAAIHTVSQSTDVPTLAQSGVFSGYSLLIDCTTADTSIAAGESCHLLQRIEGYDCLAIAQKPFTLSFWVKATKTGIHCIGFTNAGNDRSYIAEYTINTTNTWEKKVIVVPASPSAGSWNYVNGVGLHVRFSLSCGATFQTTAGAWQTGNYFGTANQVNVTDDTANDFRLAQVKLEPGSVATPFVTEMFGDELARCQRYFWKTFPYATKPAQSTGIHSLRYTVPITGTGYDPYFTIRHPVAMRTTTPTLTFYNPDAANALWRNITDAADSGAGALVIGYEHTMVISNDQVAGDGANDKVGVNLTVDIEL